MKKKVVIKTIIGLGCALICLIMMCLPIFNYVSRSAIGNSSDYIEAKNGISLINFLFNKGLVVFDSKVFELQEKFVFSKIIIYISFILVITSIVLYIYSLFDNKKIVLSIAKIILLVSIFILLIINFDVFKIANTTKYLSTFNYIYIIALIFSGGNLYFQFILDNKK